MVLGSKDGDLRQQIDQEGSRRDCPWRDHGEHDGRVGIKNFSGWPGQERLQCGGATEDLQMRCQTEIDLEVLRLKIAAGGIDGMILWKRFGGGFVDHRLHIRPISCCTSKRRFSDGSCALRVDKAKEGLSESRGSRFIQQDTGEPDRYIVGNA